MAGNSSPPVLLKIMQQKLRDIEICRKCRFFHVENDPDNGHGWHWGAGVRCSNAPFMVPWRKGCNCSIENAPHAVSEDEFEYVAINMTDPEKNCLQYGKY